MFGLSKLAGYLLSPLSLAIGLFLVAGLCLWRRQRRAGAVLFALALAGLWLASIPVVAGALAGALEARHPALTIAATPPADAIVVLGGTLGGARLPERPSFNLTPAADRVWHAAALFRARKAPWIIVSGGDDSGARAGAQPESQAVVEMLMALGVPREAIKIDAASRNTAENAARSLALAAALPAKRLLLVTSAQHMPRALKVFASQAAPLGISVVAATTDVEVLRGATDSWSWLPDAGALSVTTRALKEYAGLLMTDIMLR